jgi:hypothetical protein
MSRGRRKSIDMRRPSDVSEAKARLKFGYLYLEDLQGINK